jgi:membrane associated rhomboid family serine protease
MFFPYKDDNPTEITPYVTIGLIIFNVFTFYLQIDGVLTREYAFVPMEFFIMRELSAYPYEYVTIFTSMFMHGGFGHLFGNMLFLWIFGNNVEDVFGHFRFLVFYLVCGVVASLTHAFVYPDSSIRCLGSSGAISGMMGAYMLLYPFSYIRTFVIWISFLGGFFFLLPLDIAILLSWAFILLLCVLPIYSILHIPALYLLGVWFLLQVVYAYFKVPGVGWFAHIGGFASGFMTIFLHKFFSPYKYQVAVAKKYEVMKPEIDKDWLPPISAMLHNETKREEERWFREESDPNEHSTDE